MWSGSLPLGLPSCMSLVQGAFPLQAPLLKCDSDAITTSPVWRKRQDTWIFTFWDSGRGASACLHLLLMNSLCFLFPLAFLSVKWSESRSVMSDSSRPHGLWPARLLCPRNSPGKNIGVGCHYLLQGIFPTQELNPDPLHYKQKFEIISNILLRPPSFLISSS